MVIEVIITAIVALLLLVALKELRVSEFTTVERMIVTGVVIAVSYMTLDVTWS